MTKNNWECDDCGQEYNTKKELVEHLEEEVDEMEESRERCIYQLKVLDPRTPYV